VYEVLCREPLKTPLFGINLFAGGEREAKRQLLNDPLALLSRYIDFATLAACTPIRIDARASSVGAK